MGGGYGRCNLYKMLTGSNWLMLISLFSMARIASCIVPVLATRMYEICQRVRPQQPIAVCLEQHQPSIKSPAVSPQLSQCFRLCHKNDRKLRASSFERVNCNGRRTVAMQKLKTTRQHSNRWNHGQAIELCSDNIVHTLGRGEALEKCGLCMFMKLSIILENHSTDHK